MVQLGAVLMVSCLGWMKSMAGNDSGLRRKGLASFNEAESRRPQARSVRGTRPLWPLPPTNRRFGTKSGFQSRWLLLLTNDIVQGVPSTPGELLIHVFSGLQRWWLALTRRSGRVIGSREDQGWVCNFFVWGPL